MAEDTLSVDIDLIQIELDHNIRSLSEGWNGSIPFECCVLYEDDIANISPLNLIFSEIDICEYLSGNKYPASRLVFCPKTYPPPSTVDAMSNKITSEKCPGWINLRRALCLSALKSGCSIISNGSNGVSRDSANRVFRCGINHRGNRDDDNPTMAIKQYRTTSLINDRSNNRENGKVLNKRIKVTDKSGPSCKFQFTVKWIVNTYFFVELRLRSGCCIHTSHSRFLSPDSIPLPTRLLTSDEVENIVHVVNATSNHGSARNFIHSKTGNIISLMKSAYLCRKHNSEDQSAKDDILFMMENLVKSKDISFVSLSDVPCNEYFHKTPISGNQTNVTISTKKQFSGAVNVDEINEDSELSCLSEQITQERCDRQLAKEDTLFIAVAWIVKPAFRLFKLCPEVVWVDVTSHSNNKGFHLLTFSSRLSIGKQVVWLWIFIPNQQRFSFRWVFQEAIPTLVPKWLRDRVQFFMKDADPQQRNEIQSAMSSHFVNATEGTCGYHLVNMGWRRHVPHCANILSPSNLEKWHLVVTKIQKWIYSWMNPGYVEDEDEYQISKFLLEKFICSNVVHEIVGEHSWVIGKIIHFLRKHVYIWEHLYLHYKRSHIRHFDTAHSSPHEGTNHGLKSHSCGVKPVMNIDTSAKTLNTQTNIKCRELEGLIFQEATCTRKTWSTLPTSSHAVTVAEGILKAMMERVELYQSSFVHHDNEKSIFQVTFSRQDPLLQDHEQNDTMAETSEQDVSHIPLFSRIRTVTIDCQGFMFCTCKHFERTGLPCVHQASVSFFCHGLVNTADNGMVPSPFLGFTHHDISVRWWSQYLYYAYRSSTPHTIVDQFHTLAMCPIKGPKIRCCLPLPSNMIMPPKEILPAIYRLKNYPLHSFTPSELQDSVLCQRRVHLSQTDEEQREDEYFTYMATQLTEVSSRILNETFSTSIRNVDFSSPTREKHVPARESLKQLFQECCTEADLLGPVDGHAKLEDNLKLFLSHCNTVRATSRLGMTNQSIKDGTHNTTSPRRTVPMTHGKYNGTAKRILNTHNY